MKAPVYNLLYYLSSLTTIPLVANGFDKDSPDSCVAINQISGEDYPFFPRADWRIQIISRSQISDTALQNANVIYSLVKDKLLFTLPSLVVGGVTYDELTANQIICMQTPAQLSRDIENREMWVFNIKLTTN